MSVYHDVASSLKRYCQFERIMTLSFEPILYFYNHMCIIFLHIYICTTHDHILVKAQTNCLLTYIQNGGANAQGYTKYKLQYLSYFLTDFDQIGAKVLVF